MEPPSAQSPFAQCRDYPPLGRRVRRLLRGHHSSVITPTDSFANPIWLFFPSALASCKKSSRVATSPCCHRDLPDVISANLSFDAWSPTTAVPRSAYACFFLRVIGLPPERSGSASRFYPRIRLLAGGVFEAADISLCSGLRVCSSPRSFLPLHKVPQGSRDFYIRAERASLSLHAPDMLTVRIQAIASVITSKAANGYHFKTGQRKWPSRTRLFYPAASCGGKSVLVRQLRGPHLSTCPWCSKRSSMALTAAASPSSLPQSSTGRFEVSMVLARS